MDRAQVIERLKASNLEATRRGEDYGRDWASECAEPTELIALEVFEPCCLGSLAKALGDDDPCDFREALFGDDPDALNDHFIRGFVAGALAVWKDVKDEVESVPDSDGPPQESAATLKVYYDDPAGEFRRDAEAKELAGGRVIGAGTCLKTKTRDLEFTFEAGAQRDQAKEKLLAAGFRLDPR